jgi:sugar transferase (PEP-CTERM system associated)
LFDALFKQNVSRATLVQLVAELSWLYAAFVTALHFAGESSDSEGIGVVALLFAAAIICLNGAFGLYRRTYSLSAGAYLLRAVLAPLIGILLAFVAARFIPGTDQLLIEWWWAVALALIGLILVRHAIVLPLVGLLMPHRVLVLGTGPEARLVESSLASMNPLAVRLVGFYGVSNSHESVVAPVRVLPTGTTLEETVERLGIDEIIVAVRQQRGGVLPLRDLLDCRLTGVRVTDLARFFERVHGQVPIESLKVSWLIYGEGFRQSIFRIGLKRCMDIVLSAALMVVTAPLIIVVGALIGLEGGGSIIYRQERVGYGGRTFTAYKLRSMTRDAEKDGMPTWATANDSRVTKIGRFIRRTRIDELPQLLNVLKGEMSFVGPRPERPEFVAMLTEQIPFYAVRHSVRPGLTGWAQVRYSYGASVEQSVRKLEYDLYYVKNHSLFLDVLILLETIRVVLLGEGAR